MRKFTFFYLVSACVFILGCHEVFNESNETVSCWYNVDNNIESRSVSFENISGLKGKGGMAANSLGVGRKGAAFRTIEPGETVTIFDVDGPGVIRHIWMVPTITMRTEHDRKILLGLVIRGYWENQDYPSIETPLGNFFGICHGKTSAYESVIHSVNPKAGMNFWAPMPFSDHARFTITNESPVESRLFFNIDYTINDNLPKQFGRMNVHYRRENPTTKKKDFTILPRRMGTGRYLGTLIGIRLLGPHWWGEGEFKVYLDGDEEFPTIVGTGTEDYIGQSYGIQDKAYLRAGTALNERGLVTIYRWHDVDPIYWKEDIRATIQQIGNRKGYYERQDDWNATTFWYEPVPSDPLPDFISYEERIADYEPDFISFENAIEAEKMKLISRTGGGSAVRDTSRWWGRWSENKHLVWSNVLKGYEISFEIPVRESGVYEMFAGFSMNRAGPTLNVYWDGELIKEGIDLYEWSWMPSGSINLGTKELSKGVHKLTLEAAGGNSKALSPYSGGFDYLQLVPKD